MNPIRILFLCTHNSARSILAEAALNRLDPGHMLGYSAGSQPRENQRPHPLALQVLREAGIDTAGLRSKCWDEFAAADAPRMDLVITVCDSAAAETCPLWPGRPATAHWGLADPSVLDGSQEDRLNAFRSTLLTLRQRLRRLRDAAGSCSGPEKLQRLARELAP